jgi:hypothetical protein
VARDYPRVVAPDRSYIQKNDRERQRLRVLVAGLGDDELRRKVNEFWTVAGVFGHLAFWDARAYVLMKKAERGEAFTDSDQEPPDPTWLNDSTRALIHAIPPRAVAELALQQAEDTDGLAAALGDEVLARTWPNNANSPVSVARSDHRAEPLDEIAKVLQTTRAPAR